jgi:uncharacterized protein
MTGLLARLASILAEKEIAIFAISTFDTDYLLIRGNKAANAEVAFRERDIEVEVIRI